MCCYWFRHQKQTVSHTAKKLYDLLLSVNRTAAVLSIMIFDIVVTIAQCFYKNEYLFVGIRICFDLAQ